MDLRACEGVTRVTNFLISNPKWVFDQRNTITYEARPILGGSRLVFCAPREMVLPQDSKHYEYCYSRASLNSRLEDEKAKNADYFRAISPFRVNFGPVHPSVATTRT